MSRTRDIVVNGVVLLVARIFIALPLIKFGSDKVRNFGFVSEWIDSINVPLAKLTLAVGNTIEIFGAILLIVGLKARWAALAIALYLIPVHMIVHRFWGPDADAGEVDNFGKGMMIIGGLMYVVFFGGGPLSVDAWWRSRRLQAAESDQRKRESVSVS